MKASCQEPCQAVGTVLCPAAPGTRVPIHARMCSGRDRAGLRALIWAAHVTFEKSQGASRCPASKAAGRRGLAGGTRSLGHGPGGDRGRRWEQSHGQTQSEVCSCLLSKPCDVTRVSDRSDRAQHPRSCSASGDAGCSEQQSQLVQLTGGWIQPLCCSPRSENHPVPQRLPPGSCPLGHTG